jgi:hypothetical protein
MKDGDEYVRTSIFEMEEARLVCHGFIYVYYACKLFLLIKKYSDLYSYVNAMGIIIESTLNTLF